VSLLLLLSSHVATTTTVGSTRATSWAVATPDVPITAHPFLLLGLTTHTGTFPPHAVVSTRDTSWGVAETLTTVTATRGTTWVTAAWVAPTRATTWQTRRVLAATRPTTWDTLTATGDTRDTTWAVAATVVPGHATVIASTAGTTTAPLPPGAQTGDLLFVYAFSSTATAPTLPTGWTNSGNNAATPAYRGQYRIYDGVWTMPTFTNAVQVHAILIRGQATTTPAVSLATANATSATITWPASDTPTDLTGASVFIRTAVHSNPGVIIPTPTWIHQTPRRWHRTRVHHHRQGRHHNARAGRFGCGVQLCGVHPQHRRSQSCTGPHHGHGHPRHVVGHQRTRRGDSRHNVGQPPHLSAQYGTRRGLHGRQSPPREEHRGRSPPRSVRPARAPGSHGPPHPQPGQQPGPPGRPSTTNRTSTWATAARATGTHATTWATTAPTGTTRATTWATGQQVTGTRASTWNVAGTLATITTSRGTTWAVAGTITTVTATHSTTWATTGTESPRRMRRPGQRSHAPPEPMLFYMGNPGNRSPPHAPRVGTLPARSSRSPRRVAPPGPLLERTRHHRRDPWYNVDRPRVHSRYARHVVDGPHTRRTDLPCHVVGDPHPHHAPARAPGRPAHPPRRHGSRRGLSGYGSPALGRRRGTPSDGSPPRMPRRGRLGSPSPRPAAPCGRNSKSKVPSDASCRCGGVFWLRPVTCPPRARPGRAHTTRPGGCGYPTRTLT
jgi:hypothetical protein